MRKMYKKNCILETEYVPQLHGLNYLPFSCIQNTLAFFQKEAFGTAEEINALDATLTALYFRGYLKIIGEKSKQETTIENGKKKKHTNWFHIYAPTENFNNLKKDLTTIIKENIEILKNRQEETKQQISKNENQVAILEKL